MFGDPRKLVVFRDPRKLPKHPVTGHVLAAGMLGAEKKHDAQRLLLDRRPLNAIEDRLVGEALPFRRRLRPTRAWTGRDHTHEPA